MSIRISINVYFNGYGSIIAWVAYTAGRSYSYPSVDLKSIKRYSVESMYVDMMCSLEEIFSRKPISDKFIRANLKFRKEFGHEPNSVK